MAESVAAHVFRGDGIEAWHAASVVVIDERGLSHYFGDPHLLSFTRSTIKPFQALALLTSGAADGFAFEERDVALACASHNGDDLHREVAAAMLQKAGVPASALGCGAHLPLGMKLRDEVPSAGEDRDPLRNNCSGKHAGFLALCQYFGEPFDDYLAPSSKTQRAVLRDLGEVCDVDEATLPRGTDGCSAPNYALPLSALALGTLRLALPETAPERLRAALARIRRAMLEHPELVSGPGRFDYALSHARPGQLLVKSGAEAMQVGACLDPPLGFAIKVHDGGSRALPPISIAVLRQLGVLGPDLPAALAAYETPVIRNHKKVITGRIEATLVLERP
jgi:L-asparaginase II